MDPTKLEGADEIMRHPTFAELRVLIESLDQQADSGRIHDRVTRLLPPRVLYLMSLTRSARVLTTLAESETAAEGHAAMGANWADGFLAGAAWATRNQPIVGHHIRAKKGRR